MSKTLNTYSVVHLRREVAMLTRLLQDERARVSNLSAGWRVECQDTDRLLARLGLDPQKCRTDDGQLRVAHVLCAIGERERKASTGV